MPYYRKMIAIETYVPIAVEADSPDEAEKLIEGFNLEGKTIRLSLKDIVQVHHLEDDIPEEVMEEEYRRTRLRRKQ